LICAGWGRVNNDGKTENQLYQQAAVEGAAKGEYAISTACHPVDGAPLNGW
jgi:hypothetical protein